jgi:beta-lactamase superfamily II metal-dependent hydrolase
MSKLRADDSSSSKKLAVHLLDVDSEEYGDAVLCVFGKTSVLIDGGHRSNIGERADYASIPKQIGELLGQDGPSYSVDLLIVTHAHLDHIGCLPDMVQKDQLRADWALVADPDLGWGHTGDQDAAPLLGAFDERAGMLAAALREEPLTDMSNQDAVARLLSDALDLEGRYRQMLDTLKNKEGRPTRVVKYDAGKDGIKKIEAAFKGIGLKLLGPTREQLDAASRLVGRSLQDAAVGLADFFSNQEDASDEPDLVDVYKRIVSEQNVDATDAKGREGKAVNLQSIVTSFEYAGRKLLFAGDMQLAHPETGGDVMRAHMAGLLKEISKAGPYDFAKLSHHGSDNGFNEEVYEALGRPKWLGICAGSNSKKHPNKETLTKLKALRSKTGMTWARTDRNKLSTFKFTETTAGVEVAIKPLNVSAMNKKSSEDVSAEETSESRATAIIPAITSAPESSLSSVSSSEELSTHETKTGAANVEVIARIPYDSSRVTLTVEIEPRDGRANTSPPAQTTTQVRAREIKGENQEKERDETRTAPPARGSGSLRPLNIAGGRALPKLLFVTNSEALKERIGREECRHLLDAVTAARFPLLDLPARDAQDSTSAAPVVQHELSKDTKIEGVVILGGYNVVPSQRLYCIPRELSEKLLKDDIENDQDKYLVWSDDVYGDKERKGFPQLPVSRIPDGRSYDLIFNAIEATNSSAREGSRKDGVRNLMRPFADAVYSIIPGKGELKISAPTSSKTPPPYSLEGELIYLMLHGDHVDSTCFLGEEEPHGYVEAVNLKNVQEKKGAVVFTGCCWGALTATPAIQAGPGSDIAQKTPNASLAMRFLLYGANAFVGCTGSHYSPEIRKGREASYVGAGLPMHMAFWTALRSFPYPAKALHLAKIAYLNGMPYAQSAEKQAIEHKILREYTCLGLGW